MQKAIKSATFKALICAALAAATFGSFKFAQARILVHNSTEQMTDLPKEFGVWKTFESPFDVKKPEVVAHKYANQDNRWVGVVVRSSRSDKVLHDLTSCLINSDAKAVMEGDQRISTKSKELSATLATFNTNKGARRALLWFQKGDQTASDRWTWRLLSTTCPAVRDAANYYQVEVATEATTDKAADIRYMKELAALVFDEVAKR